MVAEVPGNESISPQIQRRLGVLNYLLVQIYDSRSAYPEARDLPKASLPSGWRGFSPSAPQQEALQQRSDDAVALAAVSGDGLADALDPRVSILEALAALPQSKSEAKVEKARRPYASWGQLATESGGQFCSAPRFVELRLIEQLLPLLHDALSALCEFHVQLEKDEELRKNHEQPLLGEDLFRRFDPLVWLGQYLMRQGGAVKAFDKALDGASNKTLENSKDVSAATLEGTALQLRGEHLFTKELPLYTAIRAAVREEESWRSLPLLKPQARQAFVQAMEDARESQSQRDAAEHGEEENGSTKNPSSEKPHTQTLNAEDLPLALKRLDEVWRLEPSCGFSAAVLGSAELQQAPLESELQENQDDDGESEESSNAGNEDQKGDPSEKRASSLNAANENEAESNTVKEKGKVSEQNSVASQEENNPIQPAQRTQMQHPCLGECMEVQLEVADEESVSFEEFWRFVMSCMETSRSLRMSVFKFARMQLSGESPIGYSSRESGENSSSLL